MKIRQRTLKEITDKNGVAPLWARLFLGSVSVFFILIALLISLIGSHGIFTACVLGIAAFFGWASFSARKNVAYEIIEVVLEATLEIIARIVITICKIFN